MKFRCLIFAASLLGLPSARAVYAPVPQPEQGKEFVLSVSAGLGYDSNIFGAASGEIDSLVYQLAPKLTFNASVTNQTFISASYELALDYFDQRPGDKTLDSHALRGRIAHTFTPATNLDVSDTFASTRNPESLLAGVPVNTDQSNYHNQFDARFTTTVTPKAGAVLKARSIYYDYRNAVLSRSLDRMENLIGVSGDFALLPETKLVAEYRHQEIDYRSSGGTKDKRSDFFMAGADYAPSPKLNGSARLGVEYRRRSGERSATAPYAELSAKYDYGRTAFVSGGYLYTLEETSDTIRFNDTRVNRFFVNVQHPLAATVVASGSVTYEPSRLQGRRGQLDIDETTTRLGAGLQCSPAKNWKVSATYDYDHVESDDFFRLVRHRMGASATFTF